MVTGGNLACREEAGTILARLCLTDFNMLKPCRVVLLTVCCRPASQLLSMYLV